MSGLIGKKIGMTSIYDNSGKNVPCTILQVGPCTIIQIKTEEKDGYSSFQLGFDDTKKEINKASQGHFKKSKSSPKRKLVEFSGYEGEFKVGDKITVDHFFEGEFVDVSGISKGKGFQGVVKRHGFAGVGDSTHGQHNRKRAPGSIGAGSDPSRVFKGMRMAGRMGGGIFSPSLMLGALTGLAFGWIAVSIFPSVQGDETLYAISGMGAVAAAILGAPISTILIVIELTGDWQAGLAVMVAVSIATAFTSKMVHRSFFLTQLERRGVHLSEGPHNYLLAKYKVISIMREIETITKINKKYLWRLVDQGQYLDAGANLETAMPMFQNGTIEYLPILSIGSEKHSTELVGALYYIDALKTFNKALFDTSKEEHS